MNASVPGLWGFVWSSLASRSSPTDLSADSPYELGRQASADSQPALSADPVLCLL